MFYLPLSLTRINILCYFCGQEDSIFAKKSKSVKVNKAKKIGLSPIGVSNKKIKLNIGEPPKVSYLFILYTQYDNGFFYY